MAGSLSFYCVFIITYTRELKRHICEGVFFGWTGSFVCVPLSLWAGGGRESAACTARIRGAVSRARPGQAEVAHGGLSVLCESTGDGVKGTYIPLRLHDVFGSPRDI